MTLLFILPAVSLAACTVVKESSPARRSRVAGERESGSFSAEWWEDWDVSHGELELVEDEFTGEPYLFHNSPGDNRTSYFIAPLDYLGDMTTVETMSFDLNSVGGRYYDSGFDFQGDVVLEGAGLHAEITIDHPHDGEWYFYEIPISGGAASWGMSELEWRLLLSDVDNLRIRAEYGVGSDDVLLADFAL